MIYKAFVNDYQSLVKLVTTYKSFINGVSLESGIKFLTYFFR